MDENDYADINNLKDICIEYDNTFLKLEIDYKLSRADKNSDNLNKINEFMFYDGNNLIGYAGVGCFGGDALEVNGMVHPDYRRRGIFTRLFTLIKDEFLRRSSKEMLLLSDNNSLGGIGFIKKTCSEYEHSEYDMNLDMAAEHKLNFDDIIFRKVKYEEMNIIDKDDFEFFSEYDLEVISEDENDGCNSFSGTYVMEKDNTIIVKVRLEVIDGIGGVYGLEVLPDFRGYGYGRELLIFSIKKLKEVNVKTITLQVVTENKNALNLYKSCGFK